ncbi:uncharacterized protein LOC112451802 [Temnothorax curvispinosus]|uniref:Uncharacterized protein LOC112451802 n=1 Tax=Temnothorax curvispinosus TaxID=300111 RepID=A0A6J1PDV2_9HYME|nr:uncharacterized protein LOC112451802 [Temnothorax curvispinosus]
MGIRAAWKEDLNATPAELVFGESIRLPGQFLSTQETTSKADTDDLITRLKQTINRLSPKIKRHGQRSTFVFKNMQTTPRVFLRHDAPHGALQPPYDGPYEVVNRGEKTFKLKINGRTINVSIDRIKPAYTLEEDSHSQTAKEDEKTEQKDQPTTEVKTRAGRTSRPPVRFNLA